MDRSTACTASLAERLLDVVQRNWATYYNPFHIPGICEWVNSLSPADREAVLEEDVFFNRFRLDANCCGRISLIATMQERKLNDGAIRCARRLGQIRRVRDGYGEYRIDLGWRTALFRRLIPLCSVIISLVSVAFIPAGAVHYPTWQQYVALVLWVFGFSALAYDWWWTTTMR